MDAVVDGDRCGTITLLESKMTVEGILDLFLTDDYRVVEAVKADLSRLVYRKAQVLGRVRLL